MNKKLKALIFLFFLPCVSFGRTYDTYRSDSFKGAFCSVIGGACVADIDPVTALFQNPAALATGDSKWDFDGDFIKTSTPNSNAYESEAVGGIGFSPGDWGLGIAASSQVDKVDSNTTLYDSNGTGQSFPSHTKAKTLQIRIPMAAQLNDKLSAGITVSILSHSQDISLANSPKAIESKPSAKSMEFTFGGLYSISKRLRLGSWFRFPKTIAENVQLSNASPAVSYLENFELHYPWIWSNGAAFSLNPHFSLFLQVDAIGITRNGYQLSYTSLSNAPNDNNVAPQGRSLEMEPHLGARYILNSHFTLHAGTYYDAHYDGNSGRTHGTGGLSWQVFDWLELLGGVDLAKNNSKFLFTLR